MTIERADILKLAELARIEISEDTIAETARRLGNVLDLVDQLQNADTRGIEPMAHPTRAIQRLREDKITETSQREPLQALAPAVERGLFLVPKVID